jgi:starch-binding outer membrane protein, SusD/RagB family
MKRISINLFLLALAFYLEGCNKALDKVPDNRAIITNTAQVSQLLTTAYPHATYMAFTEPMSDNAEDKGLSLQYTDAESYQINSQAYHFQDVTSIRYDSPTAYWDSCYSAIAAANQALTYCNGADSANYSAQKGEALVCRAYAHFMLVCLFAKTYDPSTAASDPGVPYVTHPQVSVFDKYTRGTVQSVYDSIERDLNRGLALIRDDAYGTAPKFHFTQQAAHAFAARFYLFKQNYPQVISHATAVFGGSDPATLIRDQQTAYNTLQYQQLQIAYTASTQTNNILLQETQSAYFDSYDVCRYGYGLYLNEELFGDYPHALGPFAMITYGTTPQFFNFPKWNPYYVGPALNNVRYGLVPLFSMEEVLMNRAEAYVRMQNDSAAFMDLNAWVSKNTKYYDSDDSSYYRVSPWSVVYWYGLSVDSSLIQTVLNFKRATYVQEGIRWLDNIRLKMPIVRYSSGDGKTVIDSIPANDPRRVLQLPAEAVAAGLPLNPR